MGILDMTDYKTVMAERICHDKFENDIMLVFNNFSKYAIQSIIRMIKQDIKIMEKKGVLFDAKLLEITCTMYLGLAWSMYRKGKLIQREDSLMVTLARSNIDDDLLDRIASELYKNKKCTDIIMDIAIRYYTLYLSKYTVDIMVRMEVGIHPEINYEDELESLIVEKLKSFAIYALGIGIYDEYMKYRN